MRWLRGDTLSTKRYTPSLDMRSTARTQIVANWDLDRAKWTLQTLNHFDNHAYRINTLVFDCVQFISEAAGSAPLKTRYQKEPGQFEWQGDNDLDALLQRPNIGQGGSRFMSLVAMVMCVMGFALIEKERNRAGGVMGLWVMRSDWANPIRRGDGTTDWEYRVPGRDPRILKSEDAIVVTYADTPNQRPTGIGPIEVAFRSVETITALTDFLKKFMDRGAMPLYFAIPNLEGTWANQWNSPQAVTAFRKQFNSIYGGSDSDESTIISPGIKDIKPLGFNMNELAFGDLRNVNDADVCQAFGIPPQLVGAIVGLQHSTYSNMQEARQQFYEGRMTTMWSRIDDAFSRSLLPEYFDDPRYDLAFDTSDVVALQEDNDKKSLRAVAWFEAGLASSHVAQKEAGIEPHGPDHFKYPLMVQLVPAVTSGQRASVREVPFKALSQRAAFDGDAQVEASLKWFDGMFPEYAGILSAGDDDSKWTYDADAKTYIHEDGRKLSQQRLIGLRDNAATALATQLGEIVEAEYANPKGAKGEEALILAILALYLLGRGGKNEVDAADASAVASIIGDQQAYWQGFTTDLIGGKLTLGAAIARAHLYGGATIQAYDQGQAESWGATRSLPYWPGVGTECRGNCRCYWAYTQNADGSRTAWWRDVHDSVPPECDTCWARSGQYPESTPFQLRGPDPSGKVYPVVEYYQK